MEKRIKSELEKSLEQEGWTWFVNVYDTEVPCFAHLLKQAKEQNEQILANLHEKYSDVRIEKQAYDSKGKLLKLILKTIQF